MENPLASVRIIYSLVPPNPPSFWRSSPTRSVAEPEYGIIARDMCRLHDGGFLAVEAASRQSKEACIKDMYPGTRQK